MSNSNDLTTSQVAAIIGMCTTMVIRHINSGLLEGYKTKGGHHRIPVEALEKYMVANDIPLDRLTSKEFVGVQIE